MLPSSSSANKSVPEHHDSNDEILRMTKMFDDFEFLTSNILLEFQTLPEAILMITAGDLNKCMIHSNPVMFPTTMLLALDVGCSQSHKIWRAVH